jgi:hypothetical protein
MAMIIPRNPTLNYALSYFRNNCACLESISLGVHLRNIRLGVPQENLDGVETVLPANFGCKGVPELMTAPFVVALPGLPFLYFKM